MGLQPTSATVEQQRGHGRAQLGSKRMNRVINIQKRLMKHWRAIGSDLLRRRNGWRAYRQTKGNGVMESAL
jgi:hypothetical protein